MTDIDIGIWMTGFFSGFGACAVLALTVYLLTDWIAERRA